MKKMIFAFCLAASSAILGVGSAAADKTCYKVSKMRYQNTGAYTVKKFYIMYKNDEGQKKSTVGVKDPIYANFTVTVYIEEDTGPSKNDEVWGKVDIESGETEGCRKDGTKFYYRASGGTVGYKTGGTTYNNNRCQITSRPNDEHLIDCP